MVYIQYITRFIFEMKVVIDNLIKYYPQSECE